MSGSNINNISKGNKDNDKKITATAYKFAIMYRCRDATHEHESGQFYFVEKDNLPYPFSVLIMKEGAIKKRERQHLFHIGINISKPKKDEMIYQALVGRIKVGSHNTVKKVKDFVSMMNEIMEKYVETNKNHKDPRPHEKAYQKMLDLLDMDWLN